MSVMMLASLGTLATLSLLFCPDTQLLALVTSTARKYEPMTMLSLMAVRFVLLGFTILGLILLILLGLSS